MVALAGAAFADLLWAFTPLVSVWSVHEAANRGGEAPGAALITSYLVAGALLLLAHLAACALLAGWLWRAAANARVLGRSRWPAGLAAGAWFLPLANWLLPPVIVAGVARASRASRAVPLIWSWWLAWLAGLAALVAGTALTWPAELWQIMSKVADGATVDVDRAGELLGYQIAGRLPGAVLLLAAAVLAIVVVHRVTWEQYDRFEELAAQAVPSAPVVAAPAVPSAPVVAAPVVPGAAPDAGGAAVAAPAVPVVLPRQVGAEDAADSQPDRAPAP
jgi:hypothetical protein